MKVQTFESKKEENYSTFQKLNLINEIFDIVLPIINEQYKEKLKKYNILRKKINSKNKIQENKKKLIDVFNEYNKQLKINKLLNRIKTLTESKLYITTNKNNLNFMLNSIFVISNEQLDKELKLTKILLSKYKTF